MNYCEGAGKSKLSEDSQYIIDKIPNLNRLIQEMTTKVNIKKIAVPIWKQIKSKNDYWAANEGKICIGQHKTAVPSIAHGVNTMA